MIIKGVNILELNNCLPSLDNYIAKFMDENGCSFEDACKLLDITDEEISEKVMQKNLKDASNEIN